VVNQHIINPQNAERYFVFSFHDKSLQVFDDYTRFTNLCTDIGVDFNSITAVQTQWTNHWETYKRAQDAKKR